MFLLRSTSGQSATTNSTVFFHAETAYQCSCVLRDLSNQSGPLVNWYPDRNSPEARPTLTLPRSFQCWGRRMNIMQSFRKSEQDRQDLIWKQCTSLLLATFPLPALLALDRSGYGVQGGVKAWLGATGGISQGSSCKKTACRCAHKCGKSGTNTQPEASHYLPAEKSQERYGFSNLICKTQPKHESCTTQPRERLVWNMFWLLA